MKIIVDTNIVFSALLNSNNTIGSILFNSYDLFEFYSPSYLRFEIKKHWQKLLKISKLQEDNLEASYQLVLSKIKFIDEELIPQDTWLESETLLEGVDIDDIPFVALTVFLDGKLWTGDKILYSGLKSRGFSSILNTTDILTIRG